MLGHGLLVALMVLILSVPVALQPAWAESASAQPPAPAIAVRSPRVVSGDLSWSSVWMQRGAARRFRVWVVTPLSAHWDTLSRLPEPQDVL